MKTVQRQYVVTEALFCVWGGGVGINTHSELDALTPFQKVGTGDFSNPHFSTLILKIYIHSQQLISKKLGHGQQVEERSDTWSVPQDNWKQLIDMTGYKRSILTGSVNQVVHQFVNNCVGSYSNSLRTTFLNANWQRSLGFHHP